MQNFTHDDVFGEYCTCKSVVDVVQDIIGPNITVAHSMLINKPPDSHPDISKHPMHQVIQVCFKRRFQFSKS